MPVSKKEVYKESEFKMTLGYRKNKHRDKSGKTQQEREAEKYNRQYSTSIRNDMYSYIDHQQILSGIKSLSKLVSRKEVK